LTPLAELISRLLSHEVHGIAHVIRRHARLPKMPGRDVSHAFIEQGLRIERMLLAQFHFRPMMQIERSIALVLVKEVLSLVHNCRRKLETIVPSEA
jgi:hypothetical protein